MIIFFGTKSPALWSPLKRGIFPTSKEVVGNNFRKNNLIITIEIPCKDDVHIVPTKHTV